MVGLEIMLRFRNGWVRENGKFNNGRLNNGWFNNIYNYSIGE